MISPKTAVIALNELFGKEQGNGVEINVSDLQIKNQFSATAAYQGKTYNGIGKWILINVASRCAILRLQYIEDVRSHRRRNYDQTIVQLSSASHTDKIVQFSSTDHNDLIIVV